MTRPAIRFVHTGDWQIGMTRRFLTPEAQARFSQARLDAIRAVGAVAAEHDAAFVVVAGDVFESNRLDRQVVVRALEAIGDCPVPVWLLPGNHDPLDAGSIYTSPTFREHRPPNLHLLDTDAPVTAAPGVELVGGPWRSKHPLDDPLRAAVARLEPAPGTLRIAVGHGAVDRLSPDAHDPALIHLDDLTSALDDGRIHYVALGDRHSLTAVDDAGRVRYAGAPEPTDHAELAPGHVLVVDLDERDCAAAAVRVGTWTFVRREVDLDGPGGVDDLAAWLASQPAKERTVVKVGLVGSLSVRDKVALDDVLADAADRFAALDVWERRTDLVVVPDDADLSDLDLAGFARETAEALGRLAGSDAPEAAAARDALGLLHRLARGAA